MPAIKPRYTEFNAQLRAELFHKLAAMERAGIPPLQALPVVGKASSKALQAGLEQFCQRLEQGEMLPEAGLRSRLLLPREARLVQVAGETGRLDKTFADLARRYTSRAKRQRRLRSKLTLPLAVLVLAMFAAPVPDLLRGTIGPGGYLLRTIVPVAVIYFSIRILVTEYPKLAARDQGRWLARGLLSLPLLGDLIHRRQQQEYLASLGALLEAGVPAVEALRLANDSVTNPVLRDRFSAAGDAVENGAGVSGALAQAEVLDDPQALGLVHTGEVSGRLDEMIGYQVRRLEEALDSRLDTLVQWLPRVLYLLVLGWMAGAIL